MKIITGSAVILIEDSTDIMTDEEKFLILRQKVYEESLVKVWKILRKENLNPILIKGWSAARYYPKPFMRSFGDIDLAFQPSEFEKALEISQKHKIFSLDIHKGLRHLDILCWDDLYENSRLIKLEDEDLRVLRPEDHLRVLAVHWLNDGGAYRERLWDIYFCYKSEENFDWRRCLDVLDENRRRWIICTLGVMQKYLGVSLEKTPFERDKIDLPDWFVKGLEKEWQSDVRLLPIHSFLGDRKQLWQQIKKRLPPNPIEATIEMEGSFDRRTPIFYQIGSIFLRIIPSFKRIKDSIKTNFRK